MRLTELVTPLKPLEAMAQGRLLVASDVGGHRELIRTARPASVQGRQCDASRRRRDRLLVRAISGRSHQACRTHVRRAATQLAGERRALSTGLRTPDGRSGA
jgi:hypothetical protein